MPQGYETGAAYVPVLPSFRYFQKKVRAEVSKMPDVELQVTPEVDDAAAQAELSKLEKPREVKVDADITKAKAKIFEISASRNSATVQVDADISKARARIEELERKRGDTHIDVDAEISKAEAQIAKLEAKRIHVQAKADADTARAEAQLARLGAVADGVDGKRVRIRVDAPGAANTIALLGAVGAAAGVAGGALGAALPAAVGGAAGAFGALGGSAIGVAGALSAYSSAQDKASQASGQSGSAATASATAIRNAQQAIDDARRNQARVAEDSASQVLQAQERVRDAERQYAETVRQGSEDIAEARRRVADAQRAQVTAAQQAARDVAAAERAVVAAVEAERWAQAAVNDARRESIRLLQDLQEKVDDYALSQEGADIALLRARDRLRQANESQNASDLDRREALYQVMVAEERLRDLQTEHTRDLEDLSSATARSKAGMDALGQAQRDASEASQRVRDSQEDLRVTQQRAAQAQADAAREVQDAQRDLVSTQERSARAQEDAARGVARAQRELRDTQRDVARAQEDAARDVARALQSMSDAQRSAATSAAGGADAMDQFRKKMAELSPAGRAFVNQILSMEAGYKRFRRAMETATLPGFTNLLEGVAAAEGPITRGMESIGESMSNVANAGGRLLKNPVFQGQLEQAFKNTVPVVDAVGFGILNLSAQMIHFSATSRAAMDGTASLIRGLFDGMVGFYRNLAPHADGLNRMLGETGGLFRDLLSSFGAFSGNIASNGLPIMQQFRGLLNQVMSTANTLATAGMPLLSGAASGMFGVFTGLLSVVSGLANAFGSWAGPLATMAGTVFGINKVMGLFGSSLGNVGFGLGAFTRQIDASGRSTSSFREAIRGTTGVGNKFRAGLGAIVSGGFNPLGIAMGVVGVGLGILGQHQQEAAVRTQNHLDRVNALSSALQESNGVIDENVRKTAAQELQNYKMSDGVRNLINDYVKFAGPGGAQQLTDAYLGNGQALEEVRKKLQAVVAAETTASASTTTYGAATGNTRKEVSEHGQAAQQLLDILNASSGTFQQAKTNNDQLSRAVGGTANSTARLTAEELKLFQQRQGFLNADLAHRQAITQRDQAIKNLIETQQQYGQGSLEVQAAEQQVEQSIYAVADAAGRKAVQQQGAAGTDREAAVAANGFNKSLLNQAATLGDKMPPQLQKYIRKLSASELRAAGAKVTTDEFGNAVAELPNGKTVKIDASTWRAEDKIRRLKDRVSGLSFEIPLDLKPRISKNGRVSWNRRDGSLRTSGSNNIAFARGGIARFDQGGLHGLTPMRAGVAQTVPPNTWRIVGDRAKDDEAYIPINDSPRSQSILQETAARMGYALMPLAKGMVAMFANGGTAGGKQANKAKQDTTAAAVDAGMSPEDVEALTEAVEKLTDSSDAQTKANTRLQVAGVNATRLMLQPMVAQINRQSVPAFQRVENHAGTRVVQAFNRMRAQFSPLQAGFTRTSTVGVQALTRLTNSGATTTSRLQGQFGAIRGGLRTVQNAFGGTATAVGASWSRIREASARPTRWVLRNPFNKGIIAGWNRLDREFRLNKHVKPIEVGFASGGYTGDGAKYEPKGVVHGGEFVVRKEITQRARPFLEALNDGQAEALQATGGRFARMPGYAKGGLVANTGGALNAAIARGVRVAKHLDGKRYVWGGAGPNGVDCSGFMSVITNALRGEGNPWRRLFTTASFGNGRSAGFVPGLKTAFAIGNSVSGGHMAGTLAGTNVESGGAHRTSRYGGPAVGADAPQFQMRASLPVVGGRFVSGGGGGFNPGPIVQDAFAKAFRLIGRVGEKFPGNRMATIDAGVARAGANKVKSKALDRLSRLYATAGGAAGSPEVVAAVRAVAQQFGWGSGAQWRALSSLISGESSWNPQAANPTSSARGLFQKMTSLHGPIEPTVAGQTRWGLNYIKRAYGNPANAYAKWSSRSPHWYDNGGVLPTGYGSFYNGTGRPEAVLTNQQWNDIHGAAMRGGRGPLIGNLNVPVQPGMSPDQVIDSALHKTRVAERSGRYASYSAY